MRATRTPRELEAIVAKLRVYTISDQDDAGPWIRREFPTLHYIATPSTPDGEQYYFATWTGISGDRFYRNAPGADFTTFTDEWVNANIRSKGPLGKLYPHPVLHPRGRHAVVPGADRQRPRERHEPGLRRLGRPLRLAPALRRDAAVLDAGRRLVSRDATARATPWSAPTARRYTSDQATIWRWRTAFQHDFAARMDWTIKDAARREPQPARGGERPAGHGAARRSTRQSARR